MTPQEKAWEFLIFELSACPLPDNQMPTPPPPPPPPPPPLPMVDSRDRAYRRLRMKIEGVVAPHGGGAGSRDGGRTWSITFTLDPWREAGGDWRRRDPLYVTVPARSKAVASRQGFALRGGMILSLAAGRIAPATRYALQSTKGRPPVRKIRGDASTQKLVKRRDRPRTIRDPLFGTLRLERAYGWLSGRRRIGGRPCELLLEVRDADDPASMTADVAKASPLLRRRTAPGCQRPRF